MASQFARGNRIVQLRDISDSVIRVEIDGDARELPLEPAHVPVPQQARSPARLVRARSGVVPYVAREGLLEELEAWVASPEPFAGKIVGGRGGSGKTKLGVELCRRSQEQDWLCGFLSQIADPAALEALVGVAAPRLVVIDYAESRLDQLERLLPLLAARATAEAPVRALLLVRESPQRTTDWAERLRNRTDSLDSVLDECGVCALEEIPLGTEERGALFTAAATAFIERKDSSETAPEPPPSLVDEVFASPLLVVIAAYLSVHGDAAPPVSRAELLDELLSHEQRYWRASWPEELADDVLPRRLIALATLTNAKSEADAAELLRLLPDLSDATAERRNSLARWCRRQYPGHHWWSALEPDLLGEHLVAATFSDNPQILADVLSLSDPQGVTRPLEVYARATADHPELAAAVASAVTTEFGFLWASAIEQATRETDEELLYGNAVTIAATLARVLSVVELDFKVLAEGLKSISGTNLILTPLVLAATKQLVDQGRRLAPGGEHDLRLASALTLLAMPLNASGQHEEAREASAESVALFRRLDGDAPPSIGLASALANYSMSLSALGLYEAGLQAAEESLDLYRQLATADNAFESSLANGLNNLSIRLSENDRMEDSLAAVQEATDLRRRLASTDAKYEPDLARSLNNLSISLGKLGRTDEALVASREAVEARRPLAKANPASHEAYLANSLNNFSINLAHSAQLEEAHSASAEAVSIYRKLVPLNAAAYGAEFVRALRNHSQRVSAVESVEDGLPPLEEAVEVSRQLAVSNPVAHTATLVKSLELFAVRLRQAGRDGEADEIARELEAIQSE